MYYSAKKSNACINGRICSENFEFWAQHAKIFMHNNYSDVMVAAFKVIDVWYDESIDPNNRGLVSRDYSMLLESVHGEQFRVPMALFPKLDGVKRFLPTKNAYIYFNMSDHTGAMRANVFQPQLMAVKMFEENHYLYGTERAKPSINRMFGRFVNDFAA